MFVNYHHSLNQNLCNQELFNQELLNHKQLFPAKNYCFECTYTDADNYCPGVFSIKPFVIERDIEDVCRWVNLEYARYWGMQGQSLQEVIECYSRLCDQEAVYAGFYNGELAFIAELYDPSRDILRYFYAHAAGDLGMHLLLAPATQRLPHFSRSVFASLMTFMFSLPQVKRIVVEPDARNEKIHRLNRHAGFSYHQRIYLPHKIACLATAQKIDFYTASSFHQEQLPFHLEQLPIDNQSLSSYREPLPLISQELIMNTMTSSIAETIGQHPYLASAHLQPRLWSHVNRLLVRKAISEFCHESLLHPCVQYEDAGWIQYELQPQTNLAINYRFKARLLPLNHWWIDAESIIKYESDKDVCIDALAFMLEFQKELGINSEKLPVYLEEISNTLYGSAFKHTKLGVSANELVSADFQTIEAAMMEGHPAFVANNGRVGFDAKDFRSYSPEANNYFQPIWVAVHKRHAHFACSSQLDYQQLIYTELELATIAQFERCLQQLGVVVEDYIFMPVHPWQWFNKITGIFAADIANYNIVCLGYAQDTYQAQQSIRTLFNVTNPQRHYIKMSVSILNMGFMRGLSPYYMSGTPAINDWIYQLLNKDSYLRKNGFSMLRELASVGYNNHYYERIPSRDTAYKKMLSCLWRESPIPQLQQGERLMTMAAFLYVDAQGDSLLKALIQSSGVSTSAWLKHYLKAYLTPLVHSFYTHDLVFMPHGENLIMVLNNNLPVRAIIKDIAEEIAIMNEAIKLPDLVNRVQVSVPEDMKVLSIFIDVFDGFFRYVGCLLEEHLDFSAVQFWQLVAENIYEYQAEHPHLAEKFARYDLFSERFAHSCLNRLQLVNNQQMISDLMDQAHSLQFSGELVNPLFEFKKLAAINLEAINEAKSY